MEKRAGRRREIVVALVIALAAAVLAAYARDISLARPGVTNRLGFYSGFDQGSYLRTARILAQWHFPQRHYDYEYGLGYPVLGVPFIWLGMKGDPFAVVDALAFGATAGLTYLLGLRVAGPSLRVPPEVIGVGAALVVAVSSPLLTLASRPWNSNVVVPLGVLVLLLCTSAHELTRSRCIVIGLAIGWILATRYLDAVFLGIPALALLVRSQPHERKRLVLFGGAAFALVVAVVLASQQYTFGNLLTTPYHFHHRVAGSGQTNDQSLGEYKISSIPTHFVGSFITGKQNGVRTTGDPILHQFPLLVLVPIGAWSVLRARARSRTAWFFAMLGSIVGSLFYISFAAGGAGDLVFSNARYWAPWYPLWSVLAIAGLAVGLGWFTKAAAGP